MNLIYFHQNLCNLVQDAHFTTKKQSQQKSEILKLHGCTYPSDVIQTIIVIKEAPIPCYEINILNMHTYL